MAWLIFVVHRTKHFSKTCFSNWSFSAFSSPLFEFENITLCPSHTYLERWCHVNNNSSLLVPHEVHPLICFNHNITSSEIHLVILLSSWISGYLLNSSFQEPYFTAL